MSADAAATTQTEQQAGRQDRSTEHVEGKQTNGTLALCAAARRDSLSKVRGCCWSDCNLAVGLGHGERVTDMRFVPFGSRDHTPGDVREDIRDALACLRAREE